MGRRSRASGWLWSIPSAMGTPKGGGRWNPPAGRSTPEATGGWWSPPPIQPRCRISPPSTCSPTCRPRSPNGVPQTATSPPADVAEISRLYTLRSWIEQSYKQVKNSLLGWAHYQVRKDLSIRRHWQLVCCAFSFCWWACRECGEMRSSPAVVVLKDPKHPSSATTDGVVGGKRRTDTHPPPLSWPRALRKVRSWLAPYVMLWRYWRVFSGMPPPAELRRLLEQLFAGRGLYLYVH